MEKQSIQYVDEDYHDQLLVLLREKVFHVTTQKAYRSIVKDGFVFANQDGRYPLNTASQKSFGRHNGWVCLSDLRARTDEEIEDGRTRYNFLGPSWFKEYYKEYTKLRLSYLILSPEWYPQLIPNQEARRSWTDESGYTQYVPKVECWFPGDVPLSAISKVIFVTIKDTAPKDPYLRVLHQMEWKSYRLRQRG